MSSLATPLIPMLHTFRALHKLRPSLSCPAFSVNDLPVQTIDDKRTGGSE